MLSSMDVDNSNKIQFLLQTIFLLSLFVSVCLYSQDNIQVYILSHQVFCGRFVNGHMLDHRDTNGHKIVLSHSDLSFWCYECNAYLDNYSIEVLCYEAVYFLLLLFFVNIYFEIGKLSVIAPHFYVVIS